ncbi:MAG: NTP transferase domain-containing protein [archaeon]
MKAIILAAGFGSRLGFLTNKQPKATITVASCSLATRTVKFANRIGISEIIVIGGYQSQLLWENLKDEKIIPLQNPDYHKGNIYTLVKARPYLTDDFVILNIDHLYPTHLARMIRETGSGIWAVSDFDRPLSQDDMKIQVVGDTRQGMRVKAISKELDEYDGGYCGITIVRGKDIEMFNKAFDKVLSHGRDQAVVEDVLCQLANDNQFPKVLDISGIRWLEIDTQEDLANAERILRMKPHFLD